MRFSIQNLLLVFPAWVLAFFIAPFATVQVASTTFHHNVVYSDIREIRLWGLNELADNPKLAYSQYDTAKLWNNVGNKLDRWGNAYQLIELDKTGPFGNSSSFHVYSLGADGKSNSNGNDADDINSWNLDHKRYYRQVVAAEDTPQHLWRTLWLTPLVYVAFWLVMRVVNAHRIAPQQH